MTETRRLIVEDLARHLDRELTAVMKRHVHAMALVVTPSEGQLVMTAAAGAFIQHALITAATLSGMENVAAVYDVLLSTLMSHAGQNRDQLVNLARETCTPAA